MTSLKVYLDPLPQHGQAIWRVARALTTFAPPWVTVVQAPAEADFHIIHGLGEGERLPILAGLAAGTQPPYAVVQYNVLTSGTGSAAWLPVWQHAQVVWGYYDLPTLLAADPAALPAPFAFYHAPLGIDPVFTAQPVPRATLVGTSGYVAETESVAEWAAVVDAIDAQGFHLGPRLPQLVPPSRWRVASGVSDQVLAEAWSTCRFVAAMRRVEGFEFPGVEGLACGARPVCFARPHYQQWYAEHAEYVEETTPDDVFAQLLDVVGRPYRAVTPAEQAWARARFAWGPLVRGFWDQVQPSV